MKKWLIYLSDPIVIDNHIYDQTTAVYANDYDLVNDQLIFMIDGKTSASFNLKNIKGIQLINACEDDINTLIGDGFEI